MTSVDDGLRRSGDDVWAAATAAPTPLPALPTTRDLVARDPQRRQLSVAEAVFGIATVVVDVLEELAGPHAATARQAHDVVLGTAWLGYRATARVTGALAGVAGPAVRLVVDPPLVPAPLRPRSWANDAAARWRAERPAAVRSATAARDVVVPAVVDAALAPVDLTELVVARVDLAEVVRHALDQLDLTEVVLQRVDLAGVVDAALEPMDLTGIVVERVDLAKVVEAVLDQMDLTALVKERVDLAVVVDSALDDMDLTALVRERVDLVSIAEEVIDAVDLPEIIRQSTGSVASETVRGIRMQSIGADEGVQRMVDRVILWRKGRKTDAPGHPGDYDETSAAQPGPEADGR